MMYLRMQKWAWEITGWQHINMKVYVNKTFKEIHWGAYVAALLCFITAYVTYNDHSKIKYLFEKGGIEKAVVIKLPANCHSSGRLKNYIGLRIISNGTIADLKINKKMCDTTAINDTLLIRCTDKFKKILKYDVSDTKVPKTDLYFSIFSLCLGIFFLLFGNTKNNFLFGYSKTK